MAAGQDRFGLGILVAQIEKAPGRARGVGGDDHALDHGVGIVIEQRPILEAARFALVRVADNRLGVAVGFGHRLPLDAGGEARAAPSGQPAVAHVLQHVQRATSRAAPACQPFVAARAHDSPPAWPAPASRMSAKTHSSMPPGLGGGRSGGRAVSVSALRPTSTSWPRSTGTGSSQRPAQGIAVAPWRPVRRAVPRRRAAGKRARADAWRASAAGRLRVQNGDRR